MRHCARKRKKKEAKDEAGRQHRGGDWSDLQNLPDACYGRVSERVSIQVFLLTNDSVFHCLTKKRILKFLLSVSLLLLLLSLLSFPLLFLPSYSSTQTIPSPHPLSLFPLSINRPHLLLFSPLSTSPLFPPPLPLPLLT